MIKPSAASAAVGSEAVALLLLIHCFTPYTRDATFLFTSQIRNNLTRRVRECIVVS